MSLGLWVKPTLGLACAAAVAVLLFVRPGRGAVAWREAGVLLAGMVASSVVVLGFLVVWGDALGFYTWGIEYALGAYTKALVPWPGRFAHTALWLTSLESRPLVAFVVGAILLWARGGRDVLRGETATRAAILAALSCVIYTTILIQGRTFCAYHFHPLKWGLAVTAAVLLGAAARRTSSKAVPRIATALAAAVAIGAGAGCALIDARDTDGTLLARAIRPHLAPGDEVVIFGFKPTFLIASERRTPFPFIDSLGVYSAAAGSPRFENAIGESLAAAVAEPDVTVFVVQYSVWRPEDGTPSSRAVVSKYVPEARLAELGYSRQTVVFPGNSTFDVYARQGRLDGLAWPADVVVAPPTQPQ
jgi:hypothetical protein